MLIKDKRGIAIYLVLGAVIMAVVLAGVILNIILSQATVSQHRQGRVQAYYASLAGMNYALEKLRTGAWKAGTNCTSNDCASADSCCVDFQWSNDFPASILNIASGTTNKQFQIILCSNDPTGDTCPGDLTCNTGNLPAGTNVCVYTSVKYIAP